jgi:hypothetical protein
MFHRFYMRLKGFSIKKWMAIGGWLGFSLLPCPDCGTPLILHIWPIAIPFLLIRAIGKKHKNNLNDLEISPSPDGFSASCHCVNGHEMDEIEKLSPIQQKHKTRN